MNKSVYLLNTHIINDFVIEHILQIKKDIINLTNIDFYVIIDNTNNLISEEYIEKLNINNINIFNYNYSSLFEIYGDLMFQIHRNNDLKKYIGNTIFPIFYFKSIYNNYYKYIVQEFDLIYTGNYSDLVNSFNNPNHEVIIQNNLKPIFENNLTCWFWTSSNEYFKIKPYFKRYFHELYNIYSITNNKLDDLLNYYKEGNYGHHELVISMFIKEKNINYTFIKNIIQNIKIQCAVYQLNDLIIKVYKHLFKDNLIIHPIKCMDQFNLLR